MRCIYIKHLRGRTVKSTNISLVLKGVLGSVLSDVNFIFFLFSRFSLLPSESASLYILKRKRNATLSKARVSSFLSNNSASDNLIAKYRYLPCIQHQTQTAVTYGWRAATRNVRQPSFLKSQHSKIVPILRKNVLNQYRFSKAKG